MGAAGSPQPQRATNGWGKARTMVGSACQSCPAASPMALAGTGGIRALEELHPTGLGVVGNRLLGSGAGLRSGCVSNPKQHGRGLALC